MENNINTDNNTRQQEETVQISQLVRRCLSRWYWFALSLAVCLALGVLYIFRSTPTYNTSADIQIKSNTKGASMPGDIDEFTQALWTSLNEDNKVSLFVRCIDLESGRAGDILYNKYSEVE